MESIADLIWIIYRPLTLQFNISNNIKVYPKLTSSFPPLHHHQQQLPHPLLNPGVCLHELCQTFSISSSASSASTTSLTPSSSPSHKLIIFSCNTNNIALSNYSEAVRYEKYLTVCHLVYNIQAKFWQKLKSKLRHRPTLDHHVTGITPEDSYA